MNANTKKITIDGIKVTVPVLTDKTIDIDDLKKLIANAACSKEIVQSLDCDCKPTKVNDRGCRFFEGVAILTSKSKDFEIRVYKWFSVCEDSSESFKWDAYYKAKAINMQVIDYLKCPLNGCEMFCELPKIITDVDYKQVLLDLDLEMEHEFQSA